MAKKNLAALMSGIMGVPEDVKSPEKIGAEQEVSEEKTEEVMNEVGKRGKGRPRKLVGRERTTFNIESELMRKIKYLAFVEDMTQTDIIDEAIRHYITDWEKHNGKIRLPN